MKWTTQAVLPQWNRQLALFSRETSNLSSLKAVKPTTFTNPNPNPKLNPNPDQLAHFSSDMNNMIGLKAGKTVIPRGTNAKRCIVSLSFISRPHFLPIYLGNEVETSKKKIRTIMFSSQKQACCKNSAIFEHFFLVKLSVTPFFH